MWGGGGVSQIDDDLKLKGRPSKVELLMSLVQDIRGSPNQTNDVNGYFSGIDFSRISLIWEVT